jgi:hypothetical protein
MAAALIDPVPGSHPGAEAKEARRRKTRRFGEEEIGSEDLPSQDCAPRRP